MAETKQINIIFMDDSAKDIELALDVLRSEHMNIDWERATSIAELESLMKSFKADVLFIECEAAGTKAETILALAHEIDPAVVCVVLTSAENEKRAFNLRHGGATNYILKEHLSRIIFTIEEALDKREHQKEAENLKKQIHENMTRQLMHYLKASPAIIYSLRLHEGQDRWEWVSENATSILGYTNSEILAPNWWFDNLHPIDRSRVLSGISKLSEESSLSMEYRFLKKNRTHLWLRDQKRWSVTSSGENEIVGSLTDISERKAIEEDLKLKSSALDVMSNPILITDVSSQILWTNDAFENLTGYTNEECIGKNPNELLNSGAHYSEFYSELWNTIISGNTWKNEIVNKKKNGELCTVELSITPIPGETGRINYFIGVMNDLTKRIESEKVYKDSQCLLQASIESPKDIIVFAVDLEYRFLFFNTCYKNVIKQLYGTNIEKGMNILDCITCEDDKKKAISNLGRVVSGESHASIEEYGDLNRMYYETKYNTLFNEAGAIIGATVFSVNTTQREKERQRIEKLIQGKDARIIELQKNLDKK